VFFIIAITGVMLGVMLLVVVQSVMSGFGVMHREKMVLTTGHIDVRAGGSVLYNEEELLGIIRAHPEVKAAVPYAQGLVMMTHKERPAFPIVFGLDLSQSEQVVPLSQLLVRGSMEDMDDDSVLLSLGLAQSISARVGDTVEVYTPVMLEHLKEEEVLLPRELRVAGIYETGWTPFDSGTMVGTLRLMQDLYEMDEGIHGVSIRLDKDDDDLVFALTEQLNQELPGRVSAQTWMALNRDFLWILQFEKNMMLFIMLVVVVVAAFAIAVAQYLTVIRKTREIGLLGAMGARTRHLAGIYCLQGFLIGLIGLVLGICTAVLLLHFRGPVIEGLASITQSRAALVQFYQFTQLPVNYERGDFIVISVATLCLSTAAGVIPALLAAMMKPAEALRSE
jgi:lipoprotein-releasing system permease protein